MKICVVFKRSLIVEKNLELKQIKDDTSMELLKVVSQIGQNYFFIPSHFL